MGHMQVVIILQWVLCMVIVQICSTDTTQSNTIRQPNLYSKPSGPPGKSAQQEGENTVLPAKYCLQGPPGMFTFIVVCRYRYESTTTAND